MADISITFTITPKHITDLMITVIEGGSTYWCDFIDMRGKSYSDEASWTGEWIYRVRPDGETNFKNFSHDSFKLLSARGKRRLLKLVVDDSSFDADDADYVFQEMVFGEIVYG